MKIIFVSRNKFLTKSLFYNKGDYENTKRMLARVEREK